MERKSNRVSANQWEIALEFLEKNSQIVHGYNNSNRARQISQRLWQELADLLNAEGSGTTKNYKDWATYFNNFKSKLKKMVSDLNKESTITGGGLPLAESLETLSPIEQRFLSIVGTGFGQGTPNVRVVLFPNTAMDTSTTAPESLCQQDLEIEAINIGNTSNTPQSPEASASDTQQPGTTESPRGHANSPSLSSQTRRTRRRRRSTRSKAQIEEARRILYEVETQRAAADAEQARAFNLIGQNLGRLADVAEAFLTVFQNRNQ